MNTNRKAYAGILFSAIAALALPLAGGAQEHGGGGGGGCGDVFGDLIHILRDDVTGQPILAQRWIELPAELQGYGWGYCPIAVYHDENGVQQEIDFIPYTCDMDPDSVDLVEEVDYFGRLNGGRTKERNHRMHFNEVISNINQADLVRREETGRLELGFDCKKIGEGPCAEWATIDSPMESMALYVRIMKYGHIATDPYEIDTWAHGDPKLSTQFHPALAEEDWAKFDKTVMNLLPNDGKKPSDCWDYNAAELFTDETPLNGVWDPAEPFFDIDKDGEFDDGTDGRPEPFTDLNDNGVWDPAEDFVDDNGNGVADEFAYLCSEPELLSNADFISGATNLAAAANKTGKITVDLTQYVNRILKITRKTEATESTLSTLPALYRDCWPSDVNPVDPPEEGPFFDPNYTECEIVPADPILTPEYDLYPDIQELFVDFSGLTKFKRDFENVKVILSSSETSWLLSTNESLNDWVALVNGNKGDNENFDIEGFVAAGMDVLRAIEYVHNYDPPVNLYCVYNTSECDLE